MKITEAIKRVIEKKSLDQTEAYEVCSEIINGNATPAQIAALLTALRMKGESTEELIGFVRKMREEMVNIHFDSTLLVDTCGTGGDCSGTFNISTTAAIIAAGAGCYVAKHGNRSNSSHCGSADLLEALGINIGLQKEGIEKCLKEHSIAFIFAPLFHPAMKSVSVPRTEIKIRTIFNLLGPLVNPAGVKRQVIGVCERRLLSIIAEALRNLGAEHCLVIHGADGMDEFTTTTMTYVKEIKNGKTIDYTITPEEFGLRRCSIEDLRVWNTEENKKVVNDILNCRPGPHSDIAILNAGAAIYVAGRAKSISQGIEFARESIYSKRALGKFEAWREFTNEHS
ncbi:MAG: anthranilate phosphoribosyltransferase [bacterium]